MTWKIRAQADDFFNAYAVLREANQTAMNYSPRGVSMSVGEQAVLRALTVSGVSVVCLAFSVELYVKDLYYALNIKVPHGHNILKLFEKLPEPVRQSIFTHKAVSQNPFMNRGDPLSPKIFSKDYNLFDSFIDQIKAMSDAFTRWRYAYEHASLGYDISFALLFIESIKAVADSIRALQHQEVQLKNKPKQNN